MSLAIDPEASAESAGLRWVTDAEPGLLRRRHGRGFRYFKADGSPLTDPRRLAWIRSLAIPPAWTDVWICPDRRGHLQATGRDARGRKVYRYHPEWRAARDETKYERLVAFGQALPAIRRRVARDLRRPGLSREKVLAMVVTLLGEAALRIGNEPYARENNSFGLTTLRGRHVTAGATRVRFRFRGKSGKVSDVSISDRRLARMVARLQELPGQELFQYLDDEGEAHGIRSDDVNAYLRKITGDVFTAKDFRTWEGTVIAARALATDGARDPQERSKHDVVRAVERVAERLGNTPAVSRQAYVHPEVVAAYLEGETLPGAKSSTAGSARAQQGLSREEAAVLVLLQKRVRGARRREGRSRGSSQAASRRSSARR
jgi:DNA topoisomerase-1